MLLRWPKWIENGQSTEVGNLMEGVVIVIL